MYGRFFILARHDSLCSIDFIAFGRFLYARQISFLIGRLHYALQTSLCSADNRCSLRASEICLFCTKTVTFSIHESLICVSFYERIVYLFLPRGCYYSRNRTRRRRYAEYIYIYPGVTSGITGTLTIVKLLYIGPDNAHMQCASLLKHVKD